MLGGYGMGSYGGGFGWLFMVLWLALIVGVVVAVVKWLSSASGRTGRSATDSSALDIVRERYARGEINKEEFEQLKHDLQE